MKLTKISSCALFLVLGIGTFSSAKAATVSWATLTSATSSTVSGNLVVGAQTVNLTYTGEIQFTQLNNSSTNYYTPLTTFAGGPSTSDMIAISGTTATHTFTFSTAITDPEMAIVSLGQPGDPVSYNFSAPFTILSQGPSTSYGGCATCLAGSGTSSLTGTEGDGILQFTGTFTSLSFTVTGSEYWNGFTIGAAGVPSSVPGVPEPASWSLSAFSLVVLAGVLARRRFAKAA